MAEIHGWGCAPSSTQCLFQAAAAVLACGADTSPVTSETLPAVSVEKQMESWYTNWLGSFKGCSCLPPTLCTSNEQEESPPATQGAATVVAVG